MEGSVEAYIKSARAKGVDDQEITQELSKAGCTHDAIQEALFRGNANNLPPPPPPASTNHIETMWDSFENILMFISLYVLSTSLTLLLHIFVDKWLPNVSDTSRSYYRYGSDFSSIQIRIYSAALLVSFPLFAFFFSDVTHRTLKFPYMKLLRSRRILTYITLTITFLVVLSNIIGLIYGLLGGNVSLNFLIKFFITIIIYGVIFAYFLIQVRGDKK